MISGFSGTGSEDIVATCERGVLLAAWPKGSNFSFVSFFLRDPNGCRIVILW